MTLNEHSSEIVITDANGDKTRIWGDPHVDVNGKRCGRLLRHHDLRAEERHEDHDQHRAVEEGRQRHLRRQPSRRHEGRSGLWSSTASARTTRATCASRKATTAKALDFAHDDGFNLTEAGDKGTYGWNSEFTGERVTKSEMKEMTLHANREMREGLEMNRDVGNAPSRRGSSSATWALS